MIWIFLSCASSEIPDDCETAQVVTWASFGEGFMIENCQSCHSSTSPNRYGAPMDVQFDSHEDVLSWSDSILELSVGHNPSMPPGGGVSDSDLMLLEDWLICWEGH